MNRFTKLTRLSAFALTAFMTLSFAGCRKSNPNSNGSTSVIYEYEYEYQSEDAPGGTSSQGNSSSAASQGGTSSVVTSGGTTVNGDINNITGGDSNYTEKVYNLGGRTITIASENDLAKATGIFAESVKLTEKKYNCKFKFIYKTDYQNLYQILINDHAAGKATYDAVELRGYDVYPNAAMSGAILKLNTVYDFDSNPTWANDVFGTVGKFKGSYYGIPYTPNENGIGIWYNKALFRKYNVTDPWTYVNKNQWTFDTFRTVCRQLTHPDPGGDHKKDIWAFTSEDPWLSFVSANNASLMTMTSSGPKLSLNSANALQALEFVNTLFSDNTVPDGAELKNITTNPFNAMTTGKVAMFTYHARYGAVLKSYGLASSDIGWVYMPKGPKATEYSTATGSTSSMFVIPQNSKNQKENVAAIQDLAAYWSPYREVKHKVTDKVDELYSALSTSIDANAKQVLYYQAQHATYTYVNNYGIGTFLQSDVWPTILSGKGVSSTINSYASKIQTKLTASYNGKK